MSNIKIEISVFFIDNILNFPSRYGFEN